MKLFQTKKQDDDELNYEGNAVIRMMSYMKPYWLTVAFCFVLVVIITVLELYKPILIGDAIDQFITGDYEPGEMASQRFTGVLWAAARYVVVLLLLFVCNRIQYVLLQSTGQKIIYTIRNELFTHVESLSMRFFDLTPVGKIVTRITNDVEALNDMYSNILIKLFKNVIKILGLAVVMLVLDVKMALLSFVLVPAVVVLTVIFKRISRRTYQITRTKITALNTFLSENISGMKIIQIFNREKEKNNEFAEKSEELYQANYREMMVFAIFRPSIYMLSVLALVIVLAGGSTSVFAGTLSIGTLYIFLQYINTFFEPIQDLAEQFSTLQSAIASAEKIFTLLDVKPTVNDPQDPVKLGAVKGRIEFKHVWFAYDGEDYILKDVSFTIEPGQKVAFVGATGAGKSSILNLIGRYYDIQKGEILLDGVDIRKIKKEKLRAAIGQVQQDVFLFTGDISSNIRLRNENISDEAIREAAHEVNADRFIEKLPDQYHERVSERGATFSAGQRQLLSFARTLAFDPAILILDEATANIDTETEQWIQEALEKLMTGRTTIMVAHRLSTIQHADKIIVMHKGRIRESGTHQELLEQNGIYKKLYQLQIM
ncbi:MAG TPA: ABC transporter ATP-binding protein [Candidatus Scybalocola faecavium]|nr:ABC transporter ATP-binding protein [Candidatus Scybalocola faecavium]